MGCSGHRAVKRVRDHMQQNGLSQRMVICTAILMFMASRGEGNCKEQGGKPERTLLLDLTWIYVHKIDI